MEAGMGSRASFVCVVLAAVLISIHGGEACDIKKDSAFNFLSPLNDGFEDVTKSNEECCDLCNDTPGCVAWTRFKVDEAFFKEGQCFLMDLVAPRKESSRADSGVLPVDEGDPELCKPSKGVTVSAPNIPGIGLLVVDSVGDCCTRCQATTDCKAYTWFSEGGETSGSCLLKASVGKAIPCDGCVSGVLGAKLTTKVGAGTVVVPTPAAGGKWDFLVDGVMGKSADEVWEVLQDPENAMRLGFRQLAFETSTGTKDTVEVELNSGEDITFKVVNINQKNKYLHMEVASHTRGVLSVQGVTVLLKGTEMYIQVKDDPLGVAVVEWGWKSKVEPEELTERISGVMNWFIKTMVDSFKYEFGAGKCFEELDRREVLGTCNNPLNPLKGAAFIPMRRMAMNDPVFKDEISEASGPDVSPREISNLLGAEEEKSRDNAKNVMMITDAHVAFGHFLANDVGLSPVGSFLQKGLPLFGVGRAKFNEELPIPVPKDDPVFKGKRAKKELPFDRAVWVRENNEDVVPRAVLNTATSFIDLGQVYGSENVRAASLRTFEVGTLKTGQEGTFLPYNGEGKDGEDGIGIPLENSPDSSSNFYVAGDVRANEHPGLLAMHALFLLEHNKIAEEIDEAFDGKLTDDAIYNWAKSINIAQFQSIIYSEYLPLVLGEGVVDPNDYRYNASVDPSVDAFFSTVSFRFGDSMTNDFWWKVEAGAKTPVKKPTESLPLVELFLNPDVIDASNLDDWLRGMIWHQAREMDTMMVEALRSFFLTDDPDVPRTDLYAINIQRARDLGLPQYNEAREVYGLKRAKTFEAITDDEDIAAKLETVYADVDDVDAFVGGLAETRPKGRLVGDLFFESLKDNFLRLRDGDRLFYKGFQFSEDLLDKYPRIESILQDEVKLADIILRNTKITGEEIGVDRDTVFTL